jgi:hypothetical protein
MDQSSAILAERFRPAIDLLLTAYHYAEDSLADSWQFAIGLNELQASGATLADVRWLILRGFAEHARETTIPGDSERSFRKLPATAFPLDTFVVLSARGASDLKKVFGADRKVSDAVDRQTTAKAAQSEVVAGDAYLTPEWDPVRRELRYQGGVIKRYRVPAQNQALVLEAFQESGWPEYIDDPLPPSAGQDSKERLLATIKSLNRSQRSQLIRFHGNGNGQQIYWQHVPSRDGAGVRRHR